MSDDNKNIAISYEINSKHGGSKKENFSKHGGGNDEKTTVIPPVKTPNKGG